jgi:hypothetical protein
VVDLANNKIITITNNVNITGSFFISGGNGSTLRISGGNHTLHVTGNLGDNDNNGVQYNVVNGTDAIVVDGTLYGKNNNAFTGNGSISGGTLNVKNGATCGSPCPVTGGFDNCTSDNGANTFCNTNNVLPITLLYFEATANTGAVSLKWATIMEENFDKFIIQRSQTGVEFRNIGEVKGVGRNVYDIITKYSFEDTTPMMGLCYYRLKAVDINGAYEFFDVKAVKMQGGRQLAIYPNPSAGRSIRIEANFSPSENSYLVFYNAIGTEFLNIRARSLDAEIYFEHRLEPGVYFIKYISEEYTKTVRMVVRH